MAEQYVCSERNVVVCPRFETATPHDVVVASCASCGHAILYKPLPWHPLKICTACNMVRSRPPCA
jgi:hypothetical protein